MVTKEPEREAESKGLSTKSLEVSSTCQLVWRSMKTASETD